MTQDLNKEITEIKYNHLNLPEKVTKADGQYIQYIYDASEVKLAQKVYDASNNLVKETQYVGEYIYEDGELAMIQHEEGRIVPDALNGGYEYQYKISDHLGNTRVMFTTKPKTFNFQLNYESDANLPDDEDMFEELNNIIPANIHDHTDAGSTYDQSQLLNGANGGVVGSVITIPVGMGDKVNAEVWAKYLAPTGTSNPTAAVGSILIAALTGSTGTLNYEGSITSSYGTQGSMVTNMYGDELSDTEPKAFINLMFLSDDITDAPVIAFNQIKSASSNVHAKLTLSEEFVAPGSGYIVVYLSNESENLTEVYFDDLKVTVNEHPVIQKSDFYPFGLEFSNGYQRVTAKKNDFLFNGIERETELDLGWDVAHFRSYDPAIGRWLQIDPKASERESPYVGFGNMPNFYIDPLGDTVRLLTGDDPRKNDGATYITDEVVITATPELDPASAVDGFKALGQEYAELGSKIADFVKNNDPNDAEKIEIPLDKQINTYKDKTDVDGVVVQDPDGFPGAPEGSGGTVDENNPLDKNQNATGLFTGRTKYHEYNGDTSIMLYGFERQPQVVVGNTGGGYKALGTPTKSDSAKYKIRNRD